VAAPKFVISTILIQALSRCRWALRGSQNRNFPNILFCRDEFSGIMIRLSGSYKGLQKSWLFGIPPSTAVRILTKSMIIISSKFNVQLLGLKLMDKCIPFNPIAGE
jgi:hypothetical protein